MNKGRRWLWSLGGGKGGIEKVLNSPESRGKRTNKQTERERSVSGDSFIFHTIHNFKRFMLKCKRTLLFFFIIVLTRLTLLGVLIILNCSRKKKVNETILILSSMIRMMESRDENLTPTKVTRLTIITTRDH